MHHAYCVIALLIELSEASIYLRTPCHILFLLRYIHESFLRFWLNANNSECFCFTHNVLEIPEGSHGLARKKSASKLQILSETRKLLCDILIRRICFWVLSLSQFKEERYKCREYNVEQYMRRLYLILNKG